MRRTSGGFSQAFAPEEGQVGATVLVGRAVLCDAMLSRTAASIVVRCVATYTPSLSAVSSQSANADTRRAALGVISPWQCPAVAGMCWHHALHTMVPAGAPVNVRTSSTAVTLVMALVPCGATAMPRELNKTGRDSAESDVSIA